MGDGRGAHRSYLSQTKIKESMLLLVARAQALDVAEDSQLMIPKKGLKK